MLEAVRIQSTIKPEKFLRLNDGSYYYNYDIKQELANTINENGDEDVIMYYYYVQVMLRGYPSYARCVQAIIRAYISESEEFNLINKHASQELSINNENNKEYEEYLTLLNEIKYKVRVDFNLIPEDSVKEAITKKIFEISNYDSSNAVNEFTYNEDKMWLDKDTRSGLLMRLNAEKLAGKSETTLWLGITSYTLPIESAIQMINALEVYASECYDCTASHKAAVSKLTTVEDVESYDYTTGYPEKLNF